MTRLTVERAGHEVTLTRQTFAIFLAVASAKYGITPERLFAVLFGADPNGGPETGTKAVMVQRTNLNRRLQPLGITVRSRAAGRAALYELRTVSNPVKP
jgi:hypothetical protein